MRRRRRKNFLLISLASPNSPQGLSLYYTIYTRRVASSCRLFFLSLGATLLYNRFNSQPRSALSSR